jgi:metallo-beta-lactamase class B
VSFVRSSRSLASGEVQIRPGRDLGDPATLYMNTLKSILFTSTLLLSTITYSQVKEPTIGPPEWSKEYEPFRIVGTVYYVGTADLACYLISTSKGNILINTGLAASAKIIKSNIKKLGFKYTDTKILLTTQAHFDHVGAMATIKNETGAKMFVDEKDASELADGGKSNFALGNHVTASFEPFKADRLLKDGDLIKLGDMELTMLHHPGHTKGSCSYIFNVNDGSKIYRVLIVNLPSIVVEKKFSEVADYPEIEKDYTYTFDALKKLKFDIWLSSHAGQFGMHSKHKPGDGYDPSAFIDQKGYDAAVKDLEEAFTKKSADR